MDKYFLLLVLVIIGHIVLWVIYNRLLDYHSVMTPEKHGDLWYLRCTFGRCSRLATGMYGGKIRSSSKEEMIKIIKRNYADRF